MSSAGRWDMTGMRCIVTGASKGIGLAIVEDMLQLKAEVLFTARGEEELQRVQARLASAHGSEAVHVLAADVSAAEGRRALIEKARLLWNGELDVLVNNVGTNKRKRVSEVSAEDYDEQVATNQSSCFFLCQACLPLLLKSKRPAVVNVASAAAIRSSGTGVVYAMTKAAMTHMSEALACEWAPHGIRVNAVAPWMVRTPLLEAAIAKDPSQLDEVCAATPLGRLGQPEDTAAAVVFLCMPAAAYITGQVLAIDGGLSAQGYRGPCIVRPPPPVTAKPADVSTPPA